MAGVEDGIAAALAYAADDAHGYELQSRDYDVGTDCAGLVRLYAAAVEGVALSGYPNFHTWDERQTLTARGWTATAFATDSMRRGDVLLRALGDSTGHTVVYLGDGYIVGAEGNWDGKRGDSSTTEVTKRTYYPYDYNWILRPPTIEEADLTDEQAQQLTAIYDEVTRRDDVSGRGVSMTTHEQLNYLAGVCQETRTQVLRTDDPTPREDPQEMDYHTHLKWMAYKQKLMDAKLDAILAKLGTD